MNNLVRLLELNWDLPDEGLQELLQTEDAKTIEDLHDRARETALKHFGKEIYLRGLVEWSNICRNDCFYCGIRRSNPNLSRYCLTPEEILDAAAGVYNSGIRTVVLQGGENPVAAESLVPVVEKIRALYPDMAITLSLGELPKKLYASFKKAGADRYLLRHETASEDHYSKLHPIGMTLSTRLDCLKELNRLGFQTGMGMMVGSPFQKKEDILADIRLIQDYRPQMIGIGPFIPQKDTPFGQYAAGSADLTLRLYSILRLMLPNALIPATTALSTLIPDGRKRGVLAGANVIMPSFTPSAKSGNYKLYENKTTESLGNIKAELASIGYFTGSSRGDYKEN